MRNCVPLSARSSERRRPKGRVWGVLRGKHAHFLPGEAILQWWCGKGQKTPRAHIARMAAFFGDRGGPILSPPAEASGNRKEEGFLKTAALTRRARGWRFEQASTHVPRIGPRALGRWSRLPLACSLLNRPETACLPNAFRMIFFFLDTIQRPRLPCQEMTWHARKHT